MKIVKVIIIGFIIVSIIFSCDKEPPMVNNTPPEETEVEDSIPDVIEQCVDEEAITRWDSIWIPFEGNSKKSFVEAMKQNKAWKAYGIFYSDFNTTLAFTSYDSTETRTAEEFSFRFYNKNIGCYPIRQHVFPIDSMDIDSTVEVSYISLDHDVIKDEYRVDENAINNHVEVLEVDSVNHLVKGKFACTFIKEPYQDAVYNPDTLRFFNGYFELEFEE